MNKEFVRKMLKNILLYNDTVAKGAETIDFTHTNWNKSYSDAGCYERDFCAVIIDW